MKPTTFIIGAGASIPYGFPSGRKLVENIALKSAYFDGPSTHQSRQYQEMLYRCGIDTTSKITQNFFRDVKNSQIDSIDRFLNYRKEYSEIGKIAIAHEIMLAECDSAKNSTSILYGKSEEMVYRYIIQTMTRTVLRTELLNHTYITFNYDRMLEHTVFSALVIGHGLEPNDALSLVKSMKIVHVYGSLGAYDPKINTKTGMINIIPTRSECYERTVKQLSDTIRLMYEDRGDIPTIEVISQYIQENNRAIFLGFGYDSENVNLLRNCYFNIEPITKRMKLAAIIVQHWYGSAFNKRSGDLAIAAKITGMQESNLGSPDLNDVQFLRETGLLYK